MKVNEDNYIHIPRRLTVGELKALLNEEPDDFVITVGSEQVERFQCLSGIGVDNDTGTFILYFDKES